MALIVFIVGIVFVISYLAYGYAKNRHRVNQFKNIIVANESEIKKLQETDQNLRKELTDLQTKLKHAIEDPITNLLGWQLFEDRLNQSIKESERYQFTMGVLFIDIDDFKVINDALSYVVGDDLLREVAQRLSTCIRQVDSISRFTKDTFVVLLTQLTKPETAAVVAQRMLQALAQPIQVQDHELYITACIGISIYPTDGQEAAALLRSADHALHLAKEKGKHIYQFYQERLHVKSQRELTLYNNLSRESIFNEFVLYYQPIVNVQNESIVCMDALLHWQQPEFGLIKPQELFNLAERQRKLNIITEWLLKSACRQFLHWRSLGFNPEFLGIPLSITQLETTHFIYRISQILQELEFNPHSLLLEIKESSTEISFETLEKAFNMLNYLGIKIAIDNFGAGAFSLRHLKNFVINYLKLDKSLIEDITDNPQAVALIKSLVFLTENMSMQIIIQGVDSDQQIAKLKELGCSLMQGQLFGPPLSEHEVASKMVTVME